MSEETIVPTSGSVNEAQKQEMLRIWAAMLHRIAWASGGQLVIKMSEIPEGVAFNFAVDAQGFARFTPIFPQKTSGLIKPAPGALDRLPKLPAKVNGN